jgi:phage protein D
MPLIKLLPDIFVPTFEMKVQGVPLDPLTAKSITEISVTQHLNPPSQFSITLNDLKLGFIDTQTGIFTEGTSVEINLGFVGNTKSMIVGEISALNANFPNSGPATLHVEGFDLMHRLTRGTTYRRFGGPDPDSAIPDSQIVTQIAGEVNLSPAVDTTPARTEPRVQAHISNLAFLTALAEEDDYFLWVDGNTLHFKNSQPAPNTVRLEWGKTLMTFSARLSTAGQVNSVEVRGWDPIQRQSVSARAKRSGPAQQALSATGQEQIAKGAGGASTRVIEYARVTSAQEAQALADRILFDQDRELVTGNGTSAGPPDIGPGTLLDLSGIGRFSGEYVVEQATHSIGGSGYQTSFEVKKRL